MLLSTGLSGMEKSEGRGDIQRKPYPYKAVPAEALEWDRGLFRLSLRARSFAQGNAVYAEIIASPSTDGLPLPGLFYDGRSVPLAKGTGATRGFSRSRPMKDRERNSSPFPGNRAGKW